MRNDLKDFLEALELVHRAPKNLPDTGLVVREANSDWAMGEITDELKKAKENLAYISYDLETYDDAIIEKILEVFNEGKWLILHIKKDLGSSMINQLKHLLNDGEMREVKYKGEDIYSVKMPENSRIILLAERDFIENKMTYPDFYSLLGPILSL